MMQKGQNKAVEKSIQKLRFARKRKLNIDFKKEEHAWKHYNIKYKYNQ